MGESIPHRNFAYFVVLLVISRLSAALRPSGEAHEDLTKVVEVVNGPAFCSMMVTIRAPIRDDLHRNTSQRQIPDRTLDRCALPSGTAPTLVKEFESDPDTKAPGIAEIHLAFRFGQRIPVRADLQHVIGTDASL